MKQIADFSKELGDSGSASGALVVEGGLLKAKIEVSYPVVKLAEPAMVALDKQLDKLKAAIPGTWDDALVDKFKSEYRAELEQIIAAQ